MCIYIYMYMYIYIYIYLRTSEDLTSHEFRDVSEMLVISLCVKAKSSLKITAPNFSLPASSKRSSRAARAFWAVTSGGAKAEP